MSRSEQPYVSMAVIAEHVLQERDGVASLIRIIDRVLVPMTDGKPSLPFVVNYYLVVGVRARTALGDHTLTLRTLSPTGAYTPNTLPVAIHFEDDLAGTQFAVDLKLTAEHLGYCFFDLFWDDDDEPLIRAPLKFEAEEQTNDDSSLSHA